MDAIEERTVSRKGTNIVFRMDRDEIGPIFSYVAKDGESGVMCRRDPYTLDQYVKDILKRRFQ